MLWTEDIDVVGLQEMEAAREEKAGALCAKCGCWGVDFNTLSRWKNGASCGGCDLYEMLQPL